MNRTRSRRLGLLCIATFAVSMATMPGIASSYELSSRVDLRVAWGLTSGPDGAMWLLGAKGREHSSVWRIGGDGTAKRARLKGLPRNAIFTSIATGPDGRIWAVSVTSRKVKRKTVYRSVLYRIKSINDYSATRLRKDTYVYAMAAGPDGRMWALGDWKDSIARISRDGKVSLMPFPGADRVASIAAGRLGDMWFVGDRDVARRDISGAVVRTPTAEQPATSIAIDPEGSAWIPGVGSIQKISRAGNASRAEFVSPEFSPDQALSVFMRADGRVGFLAGYSALGNVEYFVQTPSIGSVNGETVEQRSLRGTTTWFPAYRHTYETSGPNRAATGSDGQIWASTYAVSGNTGLLAFNPQTARMPGPQTSLLLGSTNRAKSMSARIECSGIPGRLCVGRAQLRSLTGSAISSAVPFSVATGQQTTVEIALSDPALRTGATVEIM